MQCTIHNVDMKVFEKNGQTWNSHKTDDPAYSKGWCNGKPVQARSDQGYTQPAPSKAKTIAEYNGRPNTYWDKKSKLIALCGMTNAMLTKGIHPADLNVDDLGRLLTRLEQKSEELTMDEIDPTV